MAFEQERQAIEAITDKHADTPVMPEFSAPVARLIERRSKTMNISPPLVIRRFQDRASGAESAHDKIGRDFYGTEFSKLSADKQSEVRTLHSHLATDDPYLRPGLTFIQARHLLLETYRSELTNRYPQEIQTGLVDFRAGLEKDIDETAKHAGFFPEYSRANQDLKNATAPPHNAQQSIPMRVRK